MVFAFILYSVIWFFMSKQFYASAHFTGSSKFAPVLYLIFGVVSFGFDAYVLARVARTYGFWYSLLCAVIALAVYYIASRLVNRIVIFRMMQEHTMMDELLGNKITYEKYNRRCDVTNSVIALVGLFVSPIAAVCLLCFKLI